MFANKRLKIPLSDRYELFRIDELEKGKRKEGFNLRVFDTNTGSSRSVNNVSEGESFFISLSLAW